MQTTEAELPRPVAPPSCPTLRLLYCGDDGVVNEPGRVLHPGEMKLGREVREAQGICLAADRRVSRVHASVRTDAGGRKVRLLDGGSKNGSFVNGHRVQESDLHDGDVIRVGSSLLLLRDEPAKQVDLDEPTIGEGQRRDPVFIAGQALGLVVYFRNLYFIIVTGRQASAKD